MKNDTWEKRYSNGGTAVHCVHDWNDKKDAFDIVAHDYEKHIFEVFPGINAVSIYATCSIKKIVWFVKGYENKIEPL